MFTGIVQGMAPITAIEDHGEFRRHTIRLPEHLAQDLSLGASVAHNGCCLTITAFQDALVSFDLIAETLKCTNLSVLKVGDCVNIERAAKFGDEIGGHVMSGHIATTTTIVDIHQTEFNTTVWLALPPELHDYVLPKGFVGLDGCSLTIGEVLEQRFSVHLIPETLERTLFGTRKQGDAINIEIDAQTQAIVDTVKRVLVQQTQHHQKAQP